MITHLFQFPGHIIQEKTFLSELELLLFFLDPVVI
jgi:hypothetical protein